MRSKALFASALALALGLPLFSADKIYFKVGSNESLEADGIKFKNMRDCPASPLPMPEARTYTRQGGAEKFEFYDALDLWRRDQCLGIWKGEAGRVIIGKIQLPVPKIEKGPDGMVMKPDYEEWRKNASPEQVKDKESITEWLEAFFSIKGMTGGETAKPAPSNCVATFFKGSSSRGDSIRYIYLLEPKVQPGARIAVCYECENAPGTDLGKSEKAIASSLSSFAFSQPKKIAAPAQAQTPGKAGKKPRSPEYLASREEVIKNIKNAKGWEYTETDNFVLVHNVKNKKTIKDISDNLEKCRAVFEAFYPLETELKAVSVCRFFEERNDYLSYVGKEYEWTGGLWASSRKELLISPCDWMTKSNSRKLMVEIAYHEGFHQYLHYAINEALSSIWFNEGNATFFEGINFKGGGKFDVETTNRLEEMKSIAASKLGIMDLVQMEHHQFISGNVDRNYALAWGLMFFLQKGAPVMKEKNNYGEIPKKYYGTLVETGDPKKANEEAWKDVDMEKFETVFKEFWNNDTLIKKAERYNPLAEQRK